MNRFLLIGVALLAAGCASSLPQVPPAGVSTQVNAPVRKAGDRWTYVARDGYTGLPQGHFDYQVKSVQGDDVTVEVQHGDRQSIERYTRDGNWRERPMTNLPSFRYEPAYAAFAFPLEAGKTWQAYVKATDPATGRTYRVRIDGKVLGWDKVKVPAGEFDAIVVRRLVYAGNADTQKGEETIEEIDWFAPRIGEVVRRSMISGHLDKMASCDRICNNWINSGWTISELERAPAR